MELGLKNWAMPDLEAKERVLPKLTFQDQKLRLRLDLVYHSEAENPN